MKKSGYIQILSTGLMVANDIPEAVRKIAANADLLAGGRRQLAQFPQPHGETVILDADTATQMPILLNAARGGKSVVILASGDALFHGIARTLLRYAEKEDDIRITPGCTAFQYLFARLKLPWDSARFFSAHGGEVPCAYDVLQSELAVIYGGSRFTATGIAQSLLQVFPGCAERQAVLAENLGMPDEQIQEGTLQVLATLPCGALSMLLLLPPSRPEQQQPTLPLGLDDDAFDHDAGMITGSEARAVILSKLRLPSSGTLWDIGAGSGSVGIEAAMLRPQLAVYAVEKDPERSLRIRANARKFGVPNYRLIEGDAAMMLTDLPTPDRIFVGGGGRDLEAILEIGFSHLNLGGILVVSAISVESVAVALAFRPEFRCQSVTLDATVLQSVGEHLHYYKNRNRITVTVWKKDSA